jgi:hypothetical protein
MSKLEILLKSLDEFFEDPVNFEQLTDVLKNQKISMRKLEFFVTKNKHIELQTPAGNTLNVHIAYKSCLNGYSKKLFDPFCRTDRIEYKGIKTTVAQLNFMRWCIKNGIIEHIKSLEDYRNRLKIQGQCVHNNTAQVQNFGTIEGQTNL